MMIAIGATTVMVIIERMKAPLSSILAFLPQAEMLVLSSASSVSSPPPLGFELVEPAFEPTVAGKRVVDALSMDVAVDAHAL